MKTDKIISAIENREFLDKIYSFSYHRCNTSYEAEDLCSEIILNVIASLQKQEKVENFYGYVWTIAHRVYADFCGKQQKNRQSISLDDNEMLIEANTNEIEKLIEETVEKEELKKVFDEICFLAKAYREVMIMYYIDEIKVKDIAMKLNIRETTVKQRLFSARNIVRKEVETMNNRNLTLKPISFYYIGMGNPIGNDPREKAERLFSQNLIYLCKEKPRSAKELSEELCVPMAFVEEELDIQCKGSNGTYGMLRKLDNGKYTINVIVADEDEAGQANDIYAKYLPEYCSILKENLNKNMEKILAFPYLSRQSDIRFILWSMVQRIMWNFNFCVNTMLADKYFADVAPAKRPFSAAAIAGREKLDAMSYGYDAISASSICGYQNVHICNMYGPRMDAHFHCAHNMANDEKLLMLLKSIGGLDIESLSENEKEIAAKAIECGYLRKDGNILTPKIIVVGDEEAFIDLCHALSAGVLGVADKLAGELAGLIRKHLPEHLLSDYQMYVQCIAGSRIIFDMTEECIKEGLLLAPEQRIGAEGMIMIVKQ